MGVVRSPLWADHMFDHSWENARESTLFQRGAAEVDRDILNMQVRLLRLFVERTGMSSEDAGRVFREGNVLGFIRDCYDSLHLSGDNCAMAEIMELLEHKGISA